MGAAAAALLMGEGAVRFFLPQATYSTIRETPGFCRHSDVYPLVLAPNTWCASMRGAEYAVHLQINALGFRDRPRALRKPPGTVRIACLGDSFTFGQGVEMEQAWPRRLEAALDPADSGRVEAWNLGYAAGFSPDAYALYCRRDLHALAPDVVVMEVFPWNDLDDIRNNLWKDPGSDGFPTRIQSTVAFIDTEGRRLSSSTYPLRLRIPVLRESQLFQLAARLATRGTGLDIAGNAYCLQVHQAELAPELREAWGKFGRSVAVADAAVKALGARLLVVLVPTVVQVAAGGPVPRLPKGPTMVYHRSAAPFDPEEPNRRIRALLAEKGIPCLDLLPVLREEFRSGRCGAEDLYFLEDGHFRPLGQDLMGKAVAQALVDRGWVHAYNPKP